MFESIIFRQQNKFTSERPLDLNALFEAMLFYGSVKVIANSSMIQQLVASCGHEFILDCLKNGFLKIEYLENNFGIHSETKNGIRQHTSIRFDLPAITPEKVIHDAFIKSVGKSGRGRRLGNRFLNTIKVISLEEEIATEITRDFKDETFLQTAVNEIIGLFAPEYSNVNDIRFRAIGAGSSLIVEDNIDWEALNSIFHKKIPKEHSTLTPEYLLANIQGARSDLYFSSREKSEIATDPVSSLIMKCKYEDVITKGIKSSKTLKEFHELVLNDAKPIYSFLQSGEKEFKDFLLLLEKAKNMRKWLNGVEPDQDLLKEYHAELIKKTWAEKLPSKTSRWTVFSGMGLGIDLLAAGGLGTIAGLGVSAFDAFVFDRFVKGWKPGHFIAEYEKFLTK